MKKILYSLMAISVMVFSFAACEEEGGEGGEKGSKVSESDIYGNWMSDSIVVTGVANPQDFYEKSPLIVTVTKDKNIILYGSDTLGVWTLSKGVLTVNGTTWEYNEVSQEHEEVPLTMEIVVVSFSKDKGVVTVKNVEQHRRGDGHGEEVFLADETIYFSRLPEPKGADVAINKANLVGTWNHLYSKYSSVSEGEQYNDLYPAHEKRTIEIKEDGCFTTTIVHDFDINDVETFTQVGVWALKQSKIMFYNTSEGVSMTPEMLLNLPDEYWDRQQTIARLTSDFLILNDHNEYEYQGTLHSSDNDEYYTRQ